MEPDPNSAAKIAAAPSATGNRRILVLALPIILALTSHSLIGLVDVWLIGHLGEYALAAIGLAGFAQYAAGAAMFGLTPAVQATVGREVGRGTLGGGVSIINTALLAAIALGTLLAAILFVFAPQLMALLSSDARVTAEALPYFRARTLALPAEGLIYALEGYWLAQGLTRRVMLTTLAMHVSNAAISYVLIFGEFGLPALGTLGAGIGTAAGLWLGAAIHLAALRAHIDVPGLFRRLVSAASALQLLRLALPASLLDLLMATGWTSFLSIVGMIGTAELAVVTVVLQLTIVVLLPAHGFGLAGGSLVAWALGRQDSHEARRCGWQVCRLAVIVGITLGATLAWFATPLLNVFLEDRSLLTMAAPLLYLTALAMSFDGFGAVLQHTLQSAGATRLATMIGGSGMWLVCIPVAYAVGPVLGGGVVAVWSAMIVFRAAMAVGYSLAWRSDAWIRIGSKI